MREPVHFIPIITTIVAIPFGIALLKRYRARGGMHLLWWAIGVFTYGIGTFTEGFTTVFGWQEPVFRAWYISGALLGGAPLAQGTVYLLLSRKTANRLSVALVAFIVVASVGVLMTPIDLSLVEPHRLTGSVMEWQRVRLFSPFINTYAFIFLVGGAALSAWRFRKHAALKHRFIGNVFIAVGALLPGIGGMATRMGHTEVLYVMELVGLLLIWTGYRYNVRPGAAGAPAVESPGEEVERAAATA
jgi:hypothetical protein